MRGLGAGAKVLDGVEIGANAVIGAGAVVRESVPERATAVGVPARVVGTRCMIRVLQICDHLGWEGSRMHGVKRLFAWMIPRFDATRFEVSLVSLRKKDLSEETLDALGIDITYLHKSKFDPATLPALLKIIDRKKIDVLHLHGYGATTFGRMAAAMRGIPAILHEHANLTDTPWFQKIADRMLERYTDIAIAVSKSTADFVVKARLVQPEKVKVVYLGAPHEEFSRPRSIDEISAARRELGIGPDDFAIGTVTRLHESKGNSYLVDAARLVLDRKPNAKFFLVGEGPLRESLEAQARQLGLGDRFVFVGFARDVAAVLSAFDLSVFPSLWEGTPLTAFEALASAKPIVATDADGLLDILTDGRDARIVPKRDARGACRCDRRSHRSPRRTRAAGRRRACHRPALRHHRLRAENGAVVRAPVRRVARDTQGRQAARAAARGLVVSRMKSRCRHVGAAVRRGRASRHRALARAGASRRRTRGGDGADAAESVRATGRGVSGHLVHRRRPGRPEQGRRSGHLAAVPELRGPPSQPRRLVEPHDA